MPDKPRYRLDLRLPSPGIIEIGCYGYLDETAHEYLPQLKAMVKAQKARVSLLYNALPLDGYSFTFPMKHIEPFRTWFGTLYKVAVAHTIPSIAFAIATVALASRTNIKG